MCPQNWLSPRPHLSGHLCQVEKLTSSVFWSLTLDLINLKDVSDQNNCHQDGCDQYLVTRTRLLQRNNFLFMQGPDFQLPLCSDLPGPGLRKGKASNNLYMMFMKTDHFVYSKCMMKMGQAFLDIKGINWFLTTVCSKRLVQYYIVSITTNIGQAFLDIQYSHALVSITS